MYKILIVDSVCARGGVINKDVNGGLGSRSKFGESIFIKLLEKIKKSGCVLPLLDYAYLIAILKNNKYSVKYIQVKEYNNFNSLHAYIDELKSDLLIYCPALVAYSNDILIAQYIKWKFPNIIEVIKDTAGGSA